jgi:hypothetical protein
MAAEGDGRAAMLADLEDAGIKLTSVATDISGPSGRPMLEALIAGQRDPAALAELASGGYGPRSRNR